MNPNNSIPSLLSKCGSCGTLKEKSDAKFCKKCGLKFTDKESFLNSPPESNNSSSELDQQRFVCSNSTCAKTFLEGRFCKQCGSKLLKIEETKASLSSPPPSESERSLSPPLLKQRSTSPSKIVRFSTPGPIRPGSNTTEKISELPEFVKTRTREDRSISVGASNFNHCSSCKVIGNGRFCSICGKNFDSFFESSTATSSKQPEVKKSSGNSFYFQ